MCYSGRCVFELGSGECGIDPEEMLHYEYGKSPCVAGGYTEIEEKDDNDEKSNN